MWYNESIFYQIYPLGFCEAQFYNDGIVSHRINKISEWISHLKNLGINSLYLQTNNMILVAEANFPLTLHLIGKFFNLYKGELFNV